MSNQSPRLTPQSVALIKHFEGRKLDAYADAVGIPTIGYGHTQGVRRGTSITPEEAEQFLNVDLSAAQMDVLRNVKVPINDNEYGALVSLAFNIGGSALARSRCLKLLNHGDREGAANEFPRFVNGHVNGHTVTLRGLELRRNAERELFLCQPGEEAKDGYVFLAGQTIPLSPEALPDPPARSAQIPDPAPVTKAKLKRKHVLVTAGLGGGLGLVPFLDGSSDKPIQDWIAKTWESSGVTKLIPEVQVLVDLFTTKLMKQPMAQAVSKIFSNISLFAHAHEGLFLLVIVLGILLTRFGYAVYPRLRQLMQ